MKKTKRIIAMLLVAVLSMAFLASCGGSESYETVVGNIVKAINEKNPKYIDKYVYKDLGDDWNEECVYEAVYKFDEDELPIKNKIVETEIYDEREDLADYEEEILEEVDCRVTLDQVVEVELETYSGIYIGLMKIEGKWYIYAIE